MALAWAGHPEGTQVATITLYEFTYEREVSCYLQVAIHESWPLCFPGRSHQIQEVRRFIPRHGSWELASAQVKSTLRTLFQYLTGCKDLWFNSLSLTCMCRFFLLPIWFYSLTLCFEFTETQENCSYISLYLNCQLDIQFVISMFHRSSRGMADGWAGIGWQGTLLSPLHITPPRTPLYARTAPHIFLCPAQDVTRAQSQASKNPQRGLQEIWAYSI